MRSAVVGTVALCVAGAAVPGVAFADVKAGVDAWQQGDYARAIAEWRPMAAAGDADAQFNLGQAYKLGRGVPVDMPVAMEWFRKASAQGHERAADNYGLLLFQQGQREKAMPFIRASADRGEPRAQYILGTAMFNGDLVPKDWVMAYALMTRAAAAGLDQAGNSLTVMDKYIPADQRKEGQALAARLSQPRTVLASAPDAMSSPTPASRQPVPSAPIRNDIPRPLAQASIPPSQATAAPPPSWTAPQPVTRPSVTAPPASGTSYPPPGRQGAPPEPVTGSPPEPAHSPAPKPPPSEPPPVASPAPQTKSPPADGAWRVQLGAFREEPRARALWARVSQTVRGMTSYQPYLVKTGDLTRLQAGPLASDADAMRLCGSIRSAGFDCMVRKR